MPNLETPAELADAVADWLGYYGTHSDSGKCALGCRLCLTTNLTERIRAAATNEKILQRERLG